jgi:hypothetical protein
MPGRDITLVGTNFESFDVRANARERAWVSTGAFLPYSTPSTQVRCSVAR